MDVDVIVVGAGPTGLMLACELALAGVRTRILERRTEPRRDSRALTLHPRSLELMDQRGLLDRFLALGRTVPGWHFAQLPTRLDFSALDSRHGYTLFLAQARTEALLAERARELGAQIRYGHEVVAVSQDGDGVEARVRGPRGDETFRARFAVGCDGGRSRIREAAGIGFPGTDETLTGVLGDVAVIDDDPAVLDAARARGVLVAPLEDGLTRLVYVDPERMRVPAREPVTLEEFRASLIRICGFDCGVGEPRWLSRFGNATRLAERYRSGRILLAGDAAHIHFPAAGQGLNTGLQDAMNLGWKLAAAVHGWSPPGLLDSYDEERNPVGRAVTGNTEVQTLLAELTLVPQYQRPGAALRELFDELLRVEEVNRELAAQVSALGTAYPPTNPGADPLVGRRMPDIGFTTTASEATRVYELLPQGRFVHLDLAGDPRLGAVVTGWGPRVTAVTVTERDDHTDLEGVREVLVRPDGHIAWATRTADLATRRDERHNALTAWAGTPS
ncbi:monooxygenase [Streptantibioticus cattleyicolor]|uniref:FAD-dependent monooxygenase n=1 Tax=Streptantibioticus cattleyicolor (strain ATCC 35852 / DSM 46488 / JCM 4925 / NBRC 14057 / NRRL 8057) TaxID=1003195 RepID=F8JJJ6_STREN|nr:monooxygenase [Streptantibioticus cattleyicolor]AEW98669.1 FAD-dependent monooxygenase [Streptantibioticus cattleyicolor NRRL 8057 = DSM 46488]CCB72273.1 putative monooxygenase [Streptantibioticus cattleyicolor NRRL 8057 = DSM 46488]